MSDTRLTIVIPTIAERVSWLAECLDGFLPLPDSGVAEIIVSGNGTADATRQVCAQRGVHLIEHQVRLSAAEHGRALLGLDVGDWTWYIPDDDLVAPHAVSRVLEYLDRYSPDVIAGRTRRFVRPDLSDLSVPVPGQRPFVVTRDIREMAKATRMRIDLGAFVFRSGLLSVDMYDRYSGTSHEPFGALWDGVDSLPEPTIVITPDVLVFARQNEKAHDDNAWRTWLGMLRVAELLPTSVRDEALESSSAVVSFRPVIRAIAEGEHPRGGDIPNSIWQRTGRARKGAFLLATRCPHSVACLALGARQRLPFLSRARGAAVAPHGGKATGLNSSGAV